jgi:hypothetical protein
MTAVDATATADVDTVKLAVVCPGATVTEAGTIAAAVLPLARETTTPAVGAGPFKVTVPVELVPPITVVGLRPRLDNTGALTVRIACLVLPAYDAVITGDVFDATGDVVIGKAALVCPDRTVTLAGATAAGLLLVRLTTMPAAGAAGLICTVPVDDVPPVTVVGLRVSWLTACGLTVRVAGLLLEL